MAYDFLSYGELCKRSTKKKLYRKRKREEEVNE